MYIELTPEDTIRDLRNLLIDAIPGFEFPRKNLMLYKIDQIIKDEADIEEGEFVIGLIWDTDMLDEQEAQQVVVEASCFQADLTTEEINILAILMMCAWTQRQVTSIEQTRMKYSGTDFKMTSQANHLQKLLTLLGECQRQSHHMQRLYKRRRLDQNGNYESNWDIFKCRHLYVHDD